jgi:hypothetical protein
MRGDYCVFIRMQLVQTEHRTDGSVVFGWACYSHTSIPRVLLQARTKEYAPLQMLGDFPDGVFDVDECPTSFEG